MEVEPSVHSTRKWRRAALLPSPSSLYGVRTIEIQACDTLVTAADPYPQTSPKSSTASTADDVCTN